MSPLLRLEHQRNRFLISYSFGIETINAFIHFRSFPGNPYPIPDQNGTKTIPFGAAHIPIWPRDNKGDREGIPHIHPIP